MKDELKTEIYLYLSMGVEIEGISKELDIPIEDINKVKKEYEEQKRKKEEPNPEPKKEKSKEEKLKEILEDNETTKSNLINVGGESSKQIKDKYLTYSYLLRELTILSTVGYEDGVPFVKPTADNDVRTLQKATNILKSLKELEWVLNDMNKGTKETDESSFEDYIGSIDEDEDEEKE